MNPVNNKGFFFSPQLFAMVFAMCLFRGIQ